METRELLDTVVEKHRQYFKDSPDGMLQPMFIVESPEGLQVIAVEFGDEQEKQILCARMRLMFKLLGVERYAFFSESWAASYKDMDELDGGKMPSQRPDRVEIIMTVAADKSGTKLGSTLEMVRGESGGVIDLKPWGAADGVDFAGRFSELLD